MFPFLKFLVIATGMLKITIINSGKKCNWKIMENNDDNIVM
jgi:hypothetical protein